MAEAGGPEALELREASFDAAHDVSLYGAVHLRHQKRLGEPPVEVTVEVGAVVLREALEVDLHNPI